MVNIQTICNYCTVSLKIERKRLLRSVHQDYRDDTYALHFHGQHSTTSPADMSTL